MKAEEKQKLLESIEFSQISENVKGGQQVAIVRPPIIVAEIKYLDLKVECCYYRSVQKNKELLIKLIDYAIDTLTNEHLTIK